MTNISRTKKTHCVVLILLLFTIFASGCGELAYKRGASASDLETAKTDCKRKAPNAAGFGECMTNKGWVIHDLGKMEPLDNDPVIEPSVIPSDRRFENSIGASPPKQNAGNHDATSKPADMNDVFKVSSWWKTGSGADALKADMKECESKLGDAHRPDVQMQRVTRGLLLCMKEKGWSALRAK